MNWSQIGQDFQQKYAETFCRYISPIDKKKEVFFVSEVHPNRDKGPDITLYNSRAGELYLNYDTEVELDFTFPECHNFLHDKKCLRLARTYVRQWRKGLCPGTATVKFPYDAIYPTMAIGDLSEDMVVNAFKPRRRISIREALLLIEREDYFSVPLSNFLSLGLGALKDEPYLWLDSEVIGVVQKAPNGDSLRPIKLHVPSFRQEVQDHLTKTGDHARPIV